VCADGSYICVYYSTVSSIVSQNDATVATTSLSYPAVYTFTLGVSYGHPPTDTYTSGLSVWYTDSISAVSGLEYFAPAPPSPPSPPPLPPLPPYPPLPPGQLGLFACCSGQAQCGGVFNDPVVCNALGDLYYSTNGGGWAENAGWAVAATGIPTDYCGGSMYTQGDYAAPAMSTRCNSAGILTGLNLASNGLSGTIPASLGDLTSLSFLCVRLQSALG